ncbi:AAA family ATPase [Actinoplanes sp. NPDC048988]|uniref:ATP-binding protein n=1 Tax=Actinoplanes sp. NPDC048988 TaxID=3363901 RepID=UPI00371AA295
MAGRERELAHLGAFVESSTTGPRSLVLLGEAGIGKSALLGAAASLARARGFRVFALHPGRPLPWALLRALCTPRLDPAARAWLATGQRLDPALLTALLLGLDRLTARRPALLLIDRAGRCDPATMRLLTEVLRHAGTSPVGVLLAARGDEGPPGLGAEINRYPVGPLESRAAARLLTSRAGLEAGAPRSVALRRAAGNPLALLSTRAPVEFRQRLDGLPHATRRLLLCAAVAADTEPLAVLNRAGAGAADLRDWQPAEDIGLISVVDGRVSFRHPLIREACTEAAGEAEVRRAHHDLAARTDDPYHRALHRALAADRPDEPAAAAIEENADHLGRRADFVAEAQAMRTAAERSPAPADAARRYAKAVVAAYRSGEPAWAIELYRAVAALTSDPDVLGAASVGAGIAMIHLGRLTEAFELLRAAVLGRPGDGQVAMVAVAAAANAAMLSGVAAHREQLPALLDLVVDGTGGELGEAMIPGSANPATRASVLAVAGLGGPGHDDDPAPLSAIAEHARLMGTSTVAWLRDDSARAAAELSALWQGFRAYGAPGALAARVPVMILAMIDSGRWAEADEALEQADGVAAVGDMTLLLNALPALRSTLDALRHGGAAPVRVRPWPTGDAFTESLRRRAFGTIALTAGDYETAYGHFRAMFGSDGGPIHYFLGPRSLPQLALSATGGVRRAQARRILRACRQRAGENVTARLAMLLAHSEAVLDDTEAAAGHFRDALSDPDLAAQWPLEYAEAQLNFAVWLRRRRRPVEARRHLPPALETFRRLGANPHAEQALKYLPQDDERSDPARAFAALTAQKQAIARLAAGGMTNREIGRRLALSPRTVGSHLYGIYPQLRVSNRNQLRVLLGGRRDA